MARIRTIKPEFWTDEKIVELSAYARLLFIGLWNFCDDSGRMVYSPKRIKMQVFPAESLDCSELLGEIRRESLIEVYVVDGVEYLSISGFDKHQKIDKRSASKLPPPPNSAESPRIPPTEWNGMEGNGVEGKGKEEKHTPPANAADPCPHQEIINLYHDHLPMMPVVREWTPARQTKLRARWKEKADRQSLDWWAGFFAYVAESDFLCGRTAKPFTCNLEWLITPTNFTKVIEGNYENRGVAA